MTDNGSLQQKKMVMFDILEILRRETDENHKLTQKELSDKLEKEYSMKVTPRTVKAGLMDMKDFGFPIEYRLVPRSSKQAGPDADPEETAICTDFYYKHEFSEAELRLLIDSLLFSKHIPTKQCKNLIKRLQGLSSNYFLPKVRHVSNLPFETTEYEQLFKTIEILDDAISRNKQVSLVYGEYKTDKKLHPVLTRTGKPSVRICNPYQIAATNGKYYLICNDDYFDNVIDIRVDKIMEIRLLDSKRRDPRTVKGLENGFDFPKHMAEHIYMFGGESGRVRFRADKKVLSELFDWFGRDMRFSDETDTHVTVSVVVNLSAMACWAKQYSEHVEVLSPQSLRERVIKDIKKGARLYGITTVQ